MSAEQPRREGSVSDVSLDVVTPGWGGGPRMPPSWCVYFCPGNMWWLFPFEFPCLLRRSLSDLLSAGNYASQHLVQPLAAFVLMDCLLHAPPWAQPLFFWGLCKNSISSHPPPAKRQGNLGGLGFWLFDFLQAVPGAQTVHGCLQLPGFRHLLICLSHLFILHKTGFSQGQCQHSRKIQFGPPSSGLGIWRPTCSGIPALPASSWMTLGKACHLSEPPFLPQGNGAWMLASPGWHDVMIAECLTLSRLQV